MLFFFLLLLEVFLRVGVGTVEKRTACYPVKGDV